MRVKKESGTENSLAGSWVVMVDGVNNVNKGRPAWDFRSRKMVFRPSTVGVSS